MTAKKQSAKSLDTLLAAYREATIARDTAASAHAQTMRQQDVLVRVLAEIAKLEADAARSRLEADLAWALDASERDDLAEQARLEALADDLRRGEERAAQLRDELQRAEVAQALRLDATYQARDALAARRSAAGLPAPRPLPYRVDGTGRAKTIAELAADLEARVSAGPKPIKDHTVRLGQLRREEQVLRAGREAEREAVERRKAEAAQRAEQDAYDQARARSVAAREAEAQAAALARQNEEIARLAAADRARGAA